MMKIEFVHNSERLEAMQVEWNALLETAITSTPFQRHEYLKVWWSTLGGGEWETGDLWLAAGRDQEGDLVGVAPLFFTNNKDGDPALLFVGSVEISDYLDLIVSEERLDEFIEVLFEALDKQGPEAWEVLELNNIPEESPSLKSLSAAAQSRGWQVEQNRLQPCPIVFLPDSWEKYLDQIDSKQAKELRRKLRKADGYPASVDWRFIEDRSELEQSVDTFLALMANDSAKDQFLTDEMRKQFHRMCEEAFNQGWLQIVFLYVSSEPIFGYVNFNYGNRIWIYNSGFNPAHFDLSPGWVLMGNLIDWAIEEGFEAIDFLRGDEVYKYRLGGNDRFIANLNIRR
jgi:CelD/BcsL family acetyltransferase involved in cellulose biosynthesis